MKKTIYKKITARGGHPFIWRIEAAKWPYSAKIIWSRSAPDSSITLSTGFKLQAPISLGYYDRKNKSYTVDLSKGDLIFIHPTEIVVRTPGTATVLIALEAEFPDSNNQLMPVPKGQLQEVTEQQFNQFPVVAVDITDFANQLLEG